MEHAPQNNGLASKSETIALSTLQMWFIIFTAILKITGRTALRFIARRIGIIPATQQDFIRDLPLEQLEALLDNILDFTSASDLNNWLAIHTTQK